MSSYKEGSISITQLKDEESYDTWKTQVIVALMGSSCYDVLDETFNPAEGDDTTKSKKVEKMNKALGVIGGTVHTRMIQFVQNVITSDEANKPKKIWHDIVNFFETISKPVARELLKEMWLMALDGTMKVV